MCTRISKQTFGGGSTVAMSKSKFVDEVASSSGQVVRHINSPLPKRMPDFVKKEHAEKVKQDIEEWKKQFRTRRFEMEQPSPNQVKTKKVASPVKTRVWKRKAASPVKTRVLERKPSAPSAVLPDGTKIHDIQVV